LTDHQADTLGRRLRFIVTAGKVGDITTASALFGGFSVEGRADKSL
jgi:hypothetical protein